jgi:hypothetical protein
MRKTLIAFAAGLMAFSALPAAAASIPQERPWTQQDNRQDRRDDRRDDRQDDRRDRRDDRQEERRDRRDDRYGRWESQWGIYPAAPPRHWSRQNDWYRHVRACQVRYRSYNPRTDTFVMRRGVVRRCRL